MDVAGLLDSVNGQPVRWDSAGALPVLTGIASASVASLGLVTGIDGRWVAPGYRAARADSEDPWQPGGAVMVRGLPDGVSLDAAGTVSVDKLAWMGARVYDPATMGFLSRDPLPGDPGSVWASNPYEYAANNPLMFSDPLGLKPLTDEQLQKHNDADNWFEGDGAWVVGAAMFVGGFCILPFCGPLGMAILSGGADTLVQKATLGTVDYGQVLVSSAFGAVGSGASTVGVKIVKAVGESAVKRAATRFAWQEASSLVLGTGQGVTTNVVTGKEWSKDIWANAATSAVGGGFSGMTGGIRGVVDDEVTSGLAAGTLSNSDALMNRVAVRFATSQVDMMGGTAQAGLKDQMADKGAGPSDLIGGAKSGAGSWSGFVPSLKSQGLIGRVK